MILRVNFNHIGCEKVEWHPLWLKVDAINADFISNCADTSFVSREIEADGKLGNMFTYSIIYTIYWMFSQTLEHNSKFLHRASAH